MTGFQYQSWGSLARAKHGHSPVTVSEALNVPADLRQGSSMLPLSIIKSMHMQKLRL